ncbi:MAG: hypothetical protein M3Q95_06335 [Bacteroidota bacterium]|nr:hypothetical protein [Bacteroidota bacterium]
MGKNIIYSFLCLAFAIVIGGGVYEHLAVVPRWAIGPPASLAMFQGPYGLKAETFWMLIHPITLLLYVIVLIISWKSARRKPVLIAFGGYVLVLVITTVYFVPELIAITTTNYSSQIDPSLTERAGMWEILSLVRLGFLILLSMVLFLGMAKEAPRKIRTT